MEYLLSTGFAKLKLNTVKIKMYNINKKLKWYIFVDIITVKNLVKIFIIFLSKQLIKKYINRSPFVR